MRAIVLSLAVLSAACGAKKVPLPIVVDRVVTVEKLVPTPMVRVPPAALLEPIQAKPPVFVSPADPKASSALTPEGERGWLELLLEYRTKYLALIAYVTSKD